MDIEEIKKDSLKKIGQMKTFSHDDNNWTGEEYCEDLEININVLCQEIEKLKGDGSK